ncbi:hypothetical protein [Arcanobacterium canis]
MRQPLVQTTQKWDAENWLAAASETIRAYCGWHVAPSLTETITLDAHGDHTLHLPSMHVTDIASVKIWGEDVTNDITWSAAGMLQYRPRSRHVFPDGFRAVEVTLTHGWDLKVVPQVQALVLTLAKRAANQAPISSQSVNGASVSYFTAGGAPLSIPLLQIEKQVLDPFKLDRGIVA